MRSSYREEDVTILLKDITGLVEPLENAERERRIQSGTHYSEMLPKEHLPSEAYLRTFYAACSRYAVKTAHAVQIAAQRIYERKNGEITLVSLARAGTPIGILLKRELERRYAIKVPHYTISIIRGRGIDKNAMRYILDRHSAASLQFVDGWTGKGAITRELLKAMQDYPEVDPGVAVLSDPAQVAAVCGTNTDFLIPSSLLNSTVSGLMSRTFRRADIIGPEDFDGAMYYEEFEQEDLSDFFLKAVEDAERTGFSFAEPAEQVEFTALDEVRSIALQYDISDINLVKPSIGEATRVLLRRVPWKILVHSLDDTAYLGHIYQLAAEKNVPLEVYPMHYYKACGLIRQLADS